MKYGIHTKPLPQFFEKNKEWWTERYGYEHHPSETSHLKFMHKVMKKNPDDVILLSTFKEEPSPVDDFRKTHVYAK